MRDHQLSHAAARASAATARQSRSPLARVERRSAPPARKDGDRRMSRRRAAGLAVLLAAAAPCASAYGAQHSPHRSGCATRNPTALTFTRPNGRTFGILKWKPGRGAQRGSGYRVLRGRAVIGETRRNSMRINVRLAHRYVVRVRLISTGGEISRCGAKLIVFSAYRLPSAPQWPAASDSSGPAAARGPT